MKGNTYLWYNMDSNKNINNNFKGCENMSIELNNKNIINPVEVYDIYKSKYPETKVKEIELESEYGFYIYEIEGYDDKHKYELKIHPLSGEILKEKTKRNKGIQGEITRNHIEKVASLVKSTLKDGGNEASLYEWEVEYEKGIPELEVEMILAGQTILEYEYNLETGNLIEKEWENPNGITELDIGKSQFEQSSRQDTDLDEFLKPVEIYNKYIEKYPGTKIKEIELESKYGFYVYEIEGYDDENKYELKVHPKSGDILKDKVKANKGIQGEITKEHINQVLDLVIFALNDVGHRAYLHEWEVEYKKGIIELKIKISIRGQEGIEYKYNLDSGKLIKKKIKYGL